MSDPFSTLGIEPALEPDEDFLRARFDALCREHHPDSGGEGEQFARVQSAFESLRDPGKRLRAWVELHGGKVDLPQDEETMAWFARVGELVQRADAVLGRKRDARTALVRAMAERDALSLLGEVEALRKELEQEKARLRGRFCDFESGVPGPGLAAAELAAGRWTFLDRWDAQLNERWIQLGM